MAKKATTGIVIDDAALKDELVPFEPSPSEEVSAEVEELPTAKEMSVEGKPLINCLKKTRVIVRRIPKNRGLVTDPRHVYSNGMAEDAVRYFTVPILKNGALANVLTTNEKNYLEYILGLPVNGLSVYRKKDNYWFNRMVKLRKQDNYFDLSVPEEYINYKILLANKDNIAPSLEEYEREPKETYEYYIVEEGSASKTASKKANRTYECYVEYGSIKDNWDKLRIIVEELTGKVISAKQKIEYLQEQVYDIISNEPQRFLDAVRDEYLETKILLKKAVDAGLVYRRSEYYFLRDNNEPLCNPNEDSTFDNAARFLALPKNQELRFVLEAKVNKS